MVMHFSRSVLSLFCLLFLCLHIVLVCSLFSRFLRSAAALSTVLPQNEQQPQHYPQYFAKSTFISTGPQGLPLVVPPAAHRAPGPPPTPAALKKPEEPLLLSLLGVNT